MPSFLINLDYNIYQPIILQFNILCLFNIQRWEYRTEDYDISFGIKLRQSDGTIKDVLPAKRVTCHMIPEDGSIVCEENWNL